MKAQYKILDNLYGYDCETKHALSMRAIAFKVENLVLENTKRRIKTAKVTSVGNLVFFRMERIARFFAKSENK